MYMVWSQAANIKKYADSFEKALLIKAQMEKIFDEIFTITDMSRF